MKSLLFVALMLVAGFTCQAQDKKTAVKTAANSAPVAAEGLVTGYESTLADGNISFTKKVAQNASGATQTSYFIRSKDNTSFNSGKAYEIQLDRESFTNYFDKSSPELSKKLPTVIKYAQDNKLSFSTEQGWIKLIAYFNGL